MPNFKVTVIAAQEDEEVEQGANLGTVVVAAENADDARAKARDELWDRRLDMASCLAVFETEQVSKFLVAEGWSHIFEGFGERTVRFVYDTAAKKIVSMSVAASLGWNVATLAQMDDVTDSLVNANEEALESPEDYGLEATDLLPDWVAA